MKHTYKCEQIKIDSSKTIFENGLENSRLLDSGCPDDCAGKSWRKTYESTTDQRYEIVQKESALKFGDKIYNSKDVKRIPISPGKMKENIEVAIIDAPLLFSKKRLKQIYSVNKQFYVEV